MFWIKLRFWIHDIYVFHFGYIKILLRKHLLSFFLSYHERKKQRKSPPNPFFLWVPQSIFCRNPEICSAGIPAISNPWKCFDPLRKNGSRLPFLQYFYSTRNGGQECGEHAPHGSSFNDNYLSKMRMPTKPLWKSLTEICSKTMRICVSCH